MSDGGDHPVRPITMLLLAAMLVLNGALVALNLDKHGRWPFDTQVADSGSSATPETIPVASSAEESSVGSQQGETQDDDIDDWPGGRGPVPTDPPVPRRVLLRGDGTAQLVGSAPTWAVATGLAESIATHLPSGLVGVDIDMTWHPDAVARTTGGAVVVDPPIVYGSGQVAIPADAEAALDLAATILAANRSVFITVVAHIDDFGDSDDNAAVALARASAVVSALGSRGVSGPRMVVVVALADPEAPANDNEEARAFNRRVELRFENLLLDRASLTAGRLDPAVSDPDLDRSDPAIDRSGSEASDADISDLDGSDDVTDGESSSLWSIDQALAADPACSEPAGGRPFRIAYAADLSPVGGPVDGPGSEAAKHLARLVSCAGGLDGQPVEVSVFDVGGSALAARASLRLLIDWGPDAVIGPQSAAPGLRLLEALSEAAPVVFPVSTEPALADPSRSSYLISADGYRLGVTAARFAIDQGWRTASILAPDGPDTGAAASGFAEAFALGGGTIIAEVAVAAAGADLSEVVAELARGTRPDVVFTDLAPSPFVALRDAAADAGLDSAFVNSNPTALAELWIEPGASGGAKPSAELVAALEGSYSVVAGAFGPDRRSGLLDEALRAVADSDAQNPLAAAAVGDAMAVIIEAYLQSGSGDGPEVGGALSDGLTAEGIRGRLRYTGPGIPSVTISLVQVVDGAAVPMATLEP